MKFISVQVQKNFLFCENIRARGVPPLAKHRSKLPLRRRRLRNTSEAPKAELRAEFLLRRTPLADHQKWNTPYAKGSSCYGRTPQAAEKSGERIDFLAEKSIR